MLEYVGIGASEGAKVLVGGERLNDGAHARGYFSSPAVMTDVTPPMRVAQEEIFGPVLGVLPAESLDHAIEIANGIRFGLSAGDLHAFADRRPTSSSTGSKRGW